MLRRRSPMKPSRGTVWPAEVRAHVFVHQSLCLGAFAGMDGPCGGTVELDHVRASGGVGMKSASIAVNAARMCSVHHYVKTSHGKTWRPRLIDAIAVLHGRCAACQRESIERYGMPLGEGVNA
jgi:hypothetical protein